MSLVVIIVTEQINGMALSVVGQSILRGVVCMAWFALFLAGWFLILIMREKTRSD